MCEEDKSQCDQVNPLNMPNIIKNVMQYLDLAEIRAARLVNKTWETEAPKFMVKFPLTFQGCDYRRKAKLTSLSLNSFLSSLILDAISNPKLVQLYQNFEMDVGSSNAQPWTGFLQVFGPHLKQLTLYGISLRMEEDSSPSSSVLYFGPILTSTPQLTHLALDLGLWNRISWTPEPGQDQHLQLNCLKSFKLLAFRGQLSVYQPPDYPLDELPRSAEESMRMRKFWHSIWMRTDGVFYWNTRPIWSVLLDIFKGSPNLETLDLTGWYYLPGSILTDILSQVSTSLTKLLLCGGGTVILNYAPGPPSTIVHKPIDYLDLVANYCLRGGILKTLIFPRPAKIYARRRAWTKLFSALSPSLVHLDLGDVSVCGDPPISNIEHLDIWLAATRNTLGQLKFDVRMDVLSTLTLHISMFSFALPPAMFPALRHLTLVVTNLEELEAQFGENSDEENESCSEFEQGENNLNGVAKLTCIFLDERRLARYEAAFKLFNILKHCMPNISNVELTNWLGFDGLLAYLNVFAGDKETAEKIQSFELKTFSYHGHLHTELCHILTGVEEPKEQQLELRGIYPVIYPTFSNSLKSFKNLSSFAFGVSSSCPIFSISSHFVLNSICQLSKLETLAFANVTIDNLVVDEIRAAIPGIRNIHISKCDVHGRGFISPQYQAAYAEYWEDD